MSAYLLPYPSAPGSIPIVGEISFKRKVIDVAELNQPLWLEESGQWLENVDRTHPMLASGEHVLLKNI